MKAKSFLFAAGMALVLAFAFSCSNGNENPFAEQYLYCVNPIEHTCIPGPFYECSQGAAPKDICPNPAWEKAPSSSSGGGGRSSSGGGDNDQLAGLILWEGQPYEFWKEFFKYYDPDYKEMEIEQRCQNGVVELRCENNVWYYPLTHVCEPWYENDEFIEVMFGKIERCGNEGSLYIDDPSHQRCQNGVVEAKCGETWYNIETHDCYYSLAKQELKAKERCGSKYIDDPPSQRCQNGVVEKRCGYSENETWFNPETHYCDWRHNDVVKAKERCGNAYVRAGYERCNNGVFEEECGRNENATWYNPITQRCDWETSTVKAKLRCGS